MSGCPGLHTSEVIQPARHVDASICIRARSGVAVPKLFHSGRIGLAPHRFNKAALSLSGIP